MIICGQWMFDNTLINNQLIHNYYSSSIFTFDWFIYLLFIINYLYINKQIQEQHSMFENHKRNLSEMVKELINELAEEKKKIAALQIEFDRMRKLTTTVWYYYLYCYYYYYFYHYNYYYINCYSKWWMVRYDTFPTLQFTWWWRWWGYINF